MSRWAEWLLLKTEDFQSIPRSPGVYEIRWAIEGKPQPIDRVDGVDAEGLLYIGKTKNLRSRTRSFWRYIKTEKSRHTAGYTYVFYDYERKFRPDQLEVRWMTVSQDEIDKEETKLLDDYINKYLDRPPLNISIKRLY